MKMDVVISGNNNLLLLINDFIGVEPYDMSQRWFYTFGDNACYFDQSYANDNELYVIGCRMFEYNKSFYNSKNMYTFNLVPGKDFSHMKKVDNDSIMHYYSAIILLLLCNFRSLLISIKIDGAIVYSVP